MLHKNVASIISHSPCTVDTRLRGDRKSLICFLCVLFMPFKLLFIELIANFIRHFYLTKKNIFYFLIFVCFLLFFLQFRFYSCWTICCFCFIAFHFSIQSLCTLHNNIILVILSLGSKKNRLS